MRYRFILPLLLGLLSCRNVPDHTVRLVETHYTTQLPPALQYQPLATDPVAPPRGSLPGPAGEQWVVHRYRVTTAAGSRRVRRDTLAVEPDGRVLFYGAVPPLT